MDAKQNAAAVGSSRACSGSCVAFHDTYAIAHVYVRAEPSGTHKGSKCKRGKWRHKFWNAVSFSFECRKKEEMPQERMLQLITQISTSQMEPRTYDIKSTDFEWKPCSFQNIVKIAARRWRSLYEEPYVRRQGKTWRKHAVTGSANSRYIHLNQIDIEIIFWSGNRPRLSTNEQIATAIVKKSKMCKWNDDWFNLMKISLLYQILCQIKCFQQNLMCPPNISFLQSFLLKRITMKSSIHV